MKCPNCSAEITGNAKFCEFCGSSISSEMRREREQVNKDGCPKCGSSNISFSREKQGEIKGKKSTSVVRSTVGVCKDCGHTWQTSGGTETIKERKTWLWVLGWIFIFPVPLAIILLRKKDMKPVVKYSIIALACILYIVLMVRSGSANADAPADDANNPVSASDSAESDATQKDTKSFVITEGEKGEYGFELTLNKDTEDEETKYYYHIPVGEYKITNVGAYRTQVSVYGDKIVKNNAGWEEFDGSFDCVAFNPNEIGTIHIGDNQLVEISPNGKVEFEKK